MAKKAAPKASTGSKKAKKSATKRAKVTTRKAAGKSSKASSKSRAKTATKKVAKKSTTASSTKSKSTTPKTKAKSTTSKAKTTRAAPAAKRPRKAVAPAPASRPPAGPVRPKAASQGPLPAAAAKRERPLTPQDVEQFRRMLIEKRNEILGDVSTLHNEALNKDRRDAVGDVSSMPIHMADLGTDNYELEFTLGLIEGERAILKEIDEALARVQNGTYGLCLATGKPIGKARLKAKPWAKYCYEYTLAQEQNQGRRF